MEKAAIQNNLDNRIALSAAEAAKALGVSKPTLYQYLRMPGFPSFKIGNRVLIGVDGLKRWVERQTEVKEDGL